MNQESYISLIIQNLSGEISLADKNKLDDWISLSGENKRIVEKVSSAWINADTYKADISILSEIIIYDDKARFLKW